MERVVIIGNSGGGKSALSRQLAVKLQLPYTDLDSILWLPGWQLALAETYQSEHLRLISQERWLLDGLGRVEHEERLGKHIFRLTSVDDLDGFLSRLEL